MKLQQINTSVFQNLRFVLVETSHPGNIGACARAIKTMGFHQLYIVRPRFADALQQEEALAFASGALDVLAAAKVVDRIEDAISDCNFTAALSARLREFSPPVLSPRELGADLQARLQKEPAPQIALIFGNERYGLPNEVVQQANVLINIPANPDYSSLNLAQAVQVLAYECRLALSAGQQTPPNASPLPGFSGESATHAQVEGMYQHLEQALIALQFLNADNPRKLMPRIKRLFGRTQLEVEEVNILRGIARQILSQLGHDKAD